MLPSMKGPQQAASEAPPHGQASGVIVLDMAAIIRQFFSGHRLTVAPLEIAMSWELRESK